MSKQTLQKKVAIGMDIGGTDIKSAVVNEKGVLLHRFSIPTQSHKSSEIILKNILKSFAKQKKWAQEQNFHIVGVGLGIPGIVSLQGVVHRSPHFPAWVDYPVQKELAEKIAFPIVVDNDANMAALGEGWKGAGQKSKNFVMLTLGTGIGGGIVIDQKIFKGDSGFAGEIGHLVLHKDGYACTCGGQGCLELYASASGLEKVSPFEAKKLYKMALQGNKKAKKILDCLGENLGAGIASVVNILDIEQVLIGGGLSAAWKVMISGIRRGVQKHIYPSTAARIRVLKAKLGNQAGVVGAAKAAFLLDSSWS